MEFYWVRGNNENPVSMKTFLCRSSGHNYILTTVDGSRYTCTCPDSVFRNKVCKHINELINHSDTPLKRITLEDAMNAVAGLFIDTGEWDSAIPPVGTFESAITVEMTPGAKQFVDSLMEGSTEPPPKVVLPEDKFDVTDVESLRKTMLAMYNNERTEDEAFVKLQGWLKMEGITVKTKDILKDWMKLVMGSWEDLLEEIGDVTD